MSQTTAIKGHGAGGWVKGSLVPGMQQARSALMPSRASMRGAYRRGGGGIGGMGAALGQYFGGGSTFRRKFPGLAQEAASWGLGNERAIGAGLRYTGRIGAGAAGLGIAMIGTSMATGVSVFDQAQGIGGGYLAYRGMAQWAGRGGMGRQVATGLGMAGAAAGAGWLSTGELMLGGMGHGAVRGAQALGVGAALVGKVPGLARFGGGYARAAGAAAGIGLGLLI
jgi:hypothetical protein